MAQSKAHFVIFHFSLLTSQINRVDQYLHRQSVLFLKVAFDALNISGLIFFRVRYRKEDGAYVLSLMYEKEPRHYKIEQHLNRLSIEGGQYFETLIEVSF